METSERLEQYILEHTTPESPLRRKLARAAHLRLIRPRMLSGHLQGNLLQMLVRLMGVRQALELGTYSGYAAHCIAEALPEGGAVHTIETDDEMEDFILDYIGQAPYGDRIKLYMGDALELGAQIAERVPLDLVYIDANKRQYPEYYEALVPRLRSGALILADNTLWDGKVIEPVREHDVQTQSILAFNRMVQEDERVENLILPLRDGLSLIRIK